MNGQWTPMAKRAALEGFPEKQKGHVWVCLFKGIPVLVVSKQNNESHHLGGFPQKTEIRPYHVFTAFLVAPLKKTWRPAPSPAVQPLATISTRNQKTKDAAAPSCIKDGDDLLVRQGGQHPGTFGAG